MRWHPDTCKCRFEVRDWDTDDATSIRTCEQHQGAGGLSDRDHFRLVYRGENQVKNFALSHIAEEAPELFPDGDLNFGIVTFSWLPDGEGQARRLEFVSKTPIAAQTRARIAAKHARFGVGKVTLR